MTGPLSHSMPAVDVGRRGNPAPLDKATVRRSDPTAKQNMRAQQLTDTDLSLPNPCYGFQHPAQGTTNAVQKRRRGKQLVHRQWLHPTRQSASFFPMHTHDRGTLRGKVGPVHARSATRDGNEGREQKAQVLPTTSGAKAGPNAPVRTACEFCACMRMCFKGSTL